MFKQLVCFLLLVLTYDLGECRSCGKPVKQPSISLDGSRQRIIGGTEAVPNSYPWIVSIHREVLGGTDHSCSGSLIRMNDGDSTDMIVTAAHCIHLDVMTHVVIGLHNQSEVTDEQKFEIADGLAHPEFNLSRSKQNDVGLVKLKTPVKFSNTVQPICLPDETEVLPNGTRTVAAGWGATNTSGEHGNVYPDVLQQVMLPIVDGEPCSSQYENPDDGDTMICAGILAGGQGVCKADSGGPLMSKLNGSYILSGIVSWGKSCAGEGNPGMFARVPKLVKWIMDNSKNMTSLK